MHVFHFGSSERRLFGAYHGSRRSRFGATGVVICQPHGHEYIRAHRTLAHLAELLSAAGAHVLRFDYFGCGDSAGEGIEGSLRHWIADTHTAIEELKDTAELSRVSLVGLRLGASLAGLAALTRTDVESLVMWDPVVKGTDYLRHQRDLQERWLATRSWMKVPRQSPTGRELIGFPLTVAQEQEFNDLNLLSTAAWSPRRTLVVTSRGVEGDTLAEHIRSIGGVVSREPVAADCDWSDTVAVHLTLLGTPVITHIEHLLAPESLA